jgi:hypothetical protein
MTSIEVTRSNWPLQQVGDIGAAIVDRKALRAGVRLGRGDIFRRGIHAGDGRTQPGERFAHQPRAAADIHRGLARKRLERAGSVPQCASTASRTNASRTGLSL